MLYFKHTHYVVNIIELNNTTDACRVNKRKRLCE